MLKFPVRLPSGNKMRVTQPYRADSPVPSSLAFSTSKAVHSGIDIDCGTPEQTWGQEVVWPFPWTGIVYDAQVDSLMGAKFHAHSQIDTTDPNTGIQYSVVYIHLSEVTKSKAPEDFTFITYNQGDVIGKIGNNGFVSPVPTQEQPYNGSHLHLGLSVKKPGETNFNLIDPQTMFDVNDWYVYEVSAYDKLMALADKMQSTNLVQANIVRAVAGIIKAFT